MYKCRSLCRSLCRSIRSTGSAKGEDRIHAVCSKRCNYVVQCPGNAANRFQLEFHGPPEILVKLGGWRSWRYWRWSDYLMGDTNFPSLSVSNLPTSSFSVYDSILYYMSQWYWEFTRECTASLGGELSEQIDSLDQW